MWHETEMIRWLSIRRKGIIQSSDWKKSVIVKTGFVVKRYVIISVSFFVRHQKYNLDGKVCTKKWPNYSEKWINQMLHKHHLRLLWNNWQFKLFLYFYACQKYLSKTILINKYTQKMANISESVFKLLHRFLMFKWKTSFKNNYDLNF